MIVAAAEPTASGGLILSYRGAKCSLDDQCLGPPTGPNQRTSSGKTAPPSVPGDGGKKCRVALTTARAECAGQFHGTTPYSARVCCSRRTASCCGASGGQLR